MTFGTGFNPISVIHLYTRIVCSVVIPLCIASRTFCEPDSTPDHTEMHPASRIVRRRLLVSMSIRVPQFHFIFSFRSKIKLHNSLVLSGSTVNASSQNVNFLTPYVLLRNSNSSTIFLGLRIRNFLPCIRTVAQNSHQKTHPLLAAK